MAAHLSAAYQTPPIVESLIVPLPFLVPTTSYEIEIMMCHPFRPMLFRAVAIALLGLGTVVPLVAQQDASLDEKKRTILQTLSRHRQSFNDGESVPKPPGFSILQKQELDFAKRLVSEIEEVVNFHERVTASLAKEKGNHLDTWMMVSEDKARLEARLSDNGFPTFSEETLELLMRNCLVELQRLDWEEAAESVQADPTAMQLRADIERNKLQTHMAEIRSLETQLSPLERSLAAVEKGFQAGNISQSELERERVRVAELRGKLEMAFAQQEQLANQFKLEEVSNVEATAVRIKQLQRRREVVDSQIKQLSQQRQGIRSLAKRDYEIERARESIDGVERETQSHRLRIIEWKSLIELFNSTIREIREVPDEPVPAQEQK